MKSKQVSGRPEHKLSLRALTALLIAGSGVPHSFEEEEGKGSLEPGSPSSRPTPQRLLFPAGLYWEGTSFPLPSYVLSLGACKLN